jgi:hypothetical protein
MDCRDAEFYLRLRHPGRDAFEPEVAAALERHLAGCPACAAADRALGGFDRAVAAVMRDVPVPDGLRDRLFTTAATRRGAVLRRKAYRLAASAAAVLVTCGLAFGLYTATRPLPDLTERVQLGDELFQPQGGEQAIERFRKAERLPALPEQFDPTLFVHAGTERVQGRDVPVVVFRERTGPGFAKVYAFRGTAFSQKGVRDEQASHCSAKAYPDPAAGVTYVVVFTGTDLTPFLRGSGLTAAA